MKKRKIGQVDSKSSVNIQGFWKSKTKTMDPFPSVSLPILAQNVLPMKNTRNK